jgi:hypothetical protein
MPSHAEGTVGSRSALLIATERYDDQKLQGLRAPGRDASRLGEVLADPTIGGFEVTVLADRSVPDIQHGIANFCADRGPEDLLLVYLSCHGLLDRHGRLYYAGTNTQSRQELLSATAVSATWLIEQLEDCGSKQQVVILDCCHSGAFARGVKGGTEALDLQRRFQGRGRAILTASRATEYAFERGEVRGEGSISVFTDAVVDGLLSGDADRDGDGLISVNDLYDHVYERVRASGSDQTPEIWIYGGEGRVVVATNPRGARPQPLPRDIADALRNPLVRVRQGAVAELADLLTGEPGLAVSARMALEKAEADDVSEVSVLARRVLAGAGLPEVGLAGHPLITVEALAVEAERSRGSSAGLRIVEEARREAESIRMHAAEAAVESRLRAEQLEQEFSARLAAIEEELAGREAEGVRARASAEADVKRIRETAQRELDAARSELDIELAERSKEAERIDAERHEQAIARAAQLVAEAERRAAAAEQRAAKATELATGPHSMEDLIRAAQQEAERRDAERHERAVAQATQLVAEAEQRAAAAELRTSKSVERAEAVRRDADEHAKSLVSNARRNADQVIAEARAFADKLLSEAKTEADRNRRAAQRQVDELVRQRDSITEHLDELRNLLATGDVRDFRRTVDAAAALQPREQSPPDLAPASFEIVLRGFDRAQVDEYVNELTRTGRFRAPAPFEIVMRGYDRDQVNDWIARAQANLPN